MLLSGLLMYPTAGPVGDPEDAAIVFRTHEAYELVRCASSATNALRAAQVVWDMLGISLDIFEAPPDTAQLAGLSEDARRAVEVALDSWGWLLLRGAQYREDWYAVYPPPSPDKPGPIYHPAHHFRYRP